MDRKFFEKYAEDMLFFAKTVYDLADDGNISVSSAFEVFTTSVKNIMKENSRENIELFCANCICEKMKEYESNAGVVK